MLAWPVEQVEDLLQDGRSRCPPRRFGGPDSRQHDAGVDENEGGGEQQNHLVKAVGRIGSSSKNRHFDTLTFVRLMPSDLLILMDRGQAGLFSWTHPDGLASYPRSALSWVVVAPNRPDGAG